MKRNKGRKTIFSDEQIRFLNDLRKNQLDKYSSEDQNRLRFEIRGQVDRAFCDLDFFILAMKHYRELAMRHYKDI